MKILKPGTDLDLFCRQLKTSPNKLLILDYDGTLAPFQIDPGKARPYPGVIEKLNEIMEHPNTNLVIVSGRWTRDLLPLLRLNRMPELWGSHGLERLKKDGNYEVFNMDEKGLDGLVLADESVEQMGLSGRFEKKPGCLAVHWRGVNQRKAGEMKALIMKKWALIAMSYGLLLKEFDGGMELRVPGRNKGDAVKILLSESPRHTVAAYLGDDLTDEDAFNAIDDKGISVLVREKLRKTRADIWIKPPEELLDFLSLWISGKNW
ncbi:MAG: trehalose-phosphatase [Deltaproteobacteria bacterium]|nr:trehalose-phosphatase [Deltaproteobacteria bacterium]